MFVQGYLVEVVCWIVVEKCFNVWYGFWYVWVIGFLGGDEKIVVISCNYIKVCEFKIVVGFVSFFLDIGMCIVYILFEEGGCFFY